MRPTRPTLLVLPSLLAALACSKTPAPAAPAPDAAAPPAKTGQLTGSGGAPLERPPHPAMTTSAYGYAALQAMAAAEPHTAPNGSTSRDAFKKLGTAEDGAEQAARGLFLAAWKASQNDVSQIEAAAGVMLSLVLDPDTDNYMPRLVDAYGMQLFLSAQTMSGAQVVAARSVVMASAGRAEDARKAALNIAGGNFKDPWIRYNEGLAFSILHMRGAALTAFNAAAALPDAFPRIFLERGRIHLALGELAGASDDAARALKDSPRCTRCTLLGAQAAALGMNPADGLARLDNMLAGKLPSWLEGEARASAALALYRMGKAQEMTPHLEALRTLKAFAGEAAFASGLQALLMRDHAAALLALDAAVKALPPGLFRTEALRGLATASIASKDGKRALGALRAVEQDEGQSADTADRMAEALDLLGSKADADDERLRAFNLDPVNSVRAKAAGRAARPGGDGDRERVLRAWRLLGAGAFEDAEKLFRELETADAGDALLPYGRMLAQLELDKLLPPGTSPPDNAMQAAVVAMKRAGKDAPHKVFSAQAREGLINILDTGDRGVTMVLLKKFLKDPDARVARLAKEAVERDTSKPRPTANEGH